MTALRKKSLLLTGYLELLLLYYFPRDGATDKRPSVEVLTPSDPRQRGCQLSLSFSMDMNQVFDGLKKRGVVVSICLVLDMFDCVMTWKRWSHYWPFPKGIHRWLLSSWHISKETFRVHYCYLCHISVGNLCGEFTGHRWIILTKVSDAELWCFLWSAPE